MNKEAKFAKWLYYINDEGKPRWNCSQCGKVCRRDPYDKRFCSNGVMEGLKMAEMIMGAGDGWQA